MTSAKVSVVVPVYNGAQFLSEAIQSILKQSYPNFELIIIDDGSTDGSARIAESYDDKRIRLIKNEQNVGIPATLNKGLEVAEGEYIVHMDADDLSLPHRIETQVNFMIRNPAVGICGSWLRTMGSGSPRTIKYPTDSDAIRAALLLLNPIGHSSVIMRKSMLDRHNLRYDPAYPVAEDYDFWVQASAHCALANIPKILVHYRVHDRQISSKRAAAMRSLCSQIRRRQLTSLGIAENATQHVIHDTLAEQRVMTSKRDIEAVEDWLIELMQRNDQLRVYSRDSLRRLMSDMWYVTCQSCPTRAWWLVAMYWRSALRPVGAAGWKRISLLLVQLLFQRGYAGADRRVG